MSLNVLGLLLCQLHGHSASVLMVAVPTKDPPTLPQALAALPPPHTAFVPLHLSYSPHFPQVLLAVACQRWGFPRVLITALLHLPSSWALSPPLVALAIL